MLVNERRVNKGLASTAPNRIRLSAQLSEKPIRMPASDGDGSSLRVVLAALAISTIGYQITSTLTQRLGRQFIAKGLKGRDLLKRPPSASSAGPADGAPALNPDL